MASRTESLGHGVQRSQLEFGKAMSDFESMFPSIDYDVIEMVLRANNGLVDATVDQLLTMQGEENETENTLVDPDLNIRLPGYNDSSSITANEPPPAYTPRVEDDPHFSYDTSFLGPKVRNINTSSSSYGTPVPCIKTNGWNPPLLGTLPSDFLRLSVHNGCELNGESSSRVGEISSSSRDQQVRGEASASRGTMGTPVTTVENTSARAVTSEFNPIPGSESRDTPASSSSGSSKHKSKRFGQMSRKFRRKKFIAKKNYQPMSSANLVDEDDELEKNDRR